MINNRKKYILVLLLIVIIAALSIRLMSTDTDEKTKSTVAVILPEQVEKGISRIMDGMHDFAINNDVELDVIYKKYIKEKEMENILDKENKNNVIGIIAVYPEKYLSITDGYEFENNNLIAVSNVMNDKFRYSIGYDREKVNADDICKDLPLERQDINDVLNGSVKMIYAGNTYELGYRSISAIYENHKGNYISDIKIDYIKIDADMINSGKVDALLTE